MPIKKKGNKYVLTSPKTGKVLAKGSKAAVTKRAGQIAFFRKAGKGKK